MFANFSSVSEQFGQNFCDQIGCFPGQHIVISFALIFLTSIIIGGLLLMTRFLILSRIILWLTTITGLGVLVLSMGPDSLVLQEGFEFIFPLRLVTFLAFSTGSIISSLLLIIAYKKRFAHDRFLYVAAALCLAGMNLFILGFRLYIKSNLSFDKMPGDHPVVVALAIATCAVLLAHIYRMRGMGIHFFRKCMTPFLLVLAITIFTGIVSFKLQIDETELLKNTQNLFLNGFELSIKETLENEVLALNILINSEVLSADKNHTVEDRISVARSILASRDIMKSIIWISPRGKLVWSLRKNPESFVERRLLHPVKHYVRQKDQIGATFLVPQDFDKDDRVEVLVPFSIQGKIKAYIVCQLDFSQLLASSFNQVPFTRFNYGLFTENGKPILSNLPDFYFPVFATQSNVEVFNKNLTVVSTPNLEGLSDFLTSLPKFTLLIGFMAALLLGHILFMYSNLLVSYDEVENLVRERTNELEEARNRAEEANETKTLFLANMSHEIRTPLNILNGVSELLWETRLSEQQKHLVSMFKQSCANLLKLVNDLIDISKVESGKIQLDVKVFNVREMVDELITLYRVKASEKAIQMASDLGGLTHFYVNGDSYRLKQVISNILMNSIKFTEKGVITIFASNDKDSFTFKITDTGVGIPQDKLDTIFERFTQIDNSLTRNKGGAGLGLAIAKHLMDLMGGEISVSSQLGQGTSFLLKIKLPLAEEPVSLPATQAADSALVPGLRVLITDDSADNRELIKIYLKKYDVDIDEAENGQVAVDKLQKEKYDCILMDMQMPVLDGYSATRKIREVENEKHLPKTPIIALTAHALREDSQKCLDAGCDDYLAKPVSKANLVSKIAHVTELSS